MSESVESNDMNTPSVIEEVPSSFPETTYEEDLEKYTKIDNLDEDKGEEQYVLVSFASPEGIMNCNIRALKIRTFNNQSVFRSYEQASSAAKELNKLDKYFPIFVMPTGKWCAWDPNPDDKKYVEDSKYSNESQQKIMDGLSQVEKKKFEVEREKQKQEKNFNEMNALIGKTKDKLDTSAKDHKKRVKDSIQQGINEKDMPKQVVQPKSHDTKELKEKLRAKIAKRGAQQNTQNELSQKVETLTEQVKETAQTSAQLEQNINKAKDLLQKMREKKETA
jgi:hypothetical protein